MSSGHCPKNLISFDPLRLHGGCAGAVAIASVKPGQRTPASSLANYMASLHRKFRPPVKLLPQSPQELQEALVTAFPAFVSESRHVDSCTDRQLRWLGELIVAAMTEGGSLGIAWDTCFLEQARQIKVSRRFAPWLAKARVKRKA